MKKFLVIAAIATGVAAVYLALKKLAQLDQGHLFVEDPGGDEEPAYTHDIWCDTTHEADGYTCPMPNVTRES